MPEIATVHVFLHMKRQVGRVTPQGGFSLIIHDSLAHARFVRRNNRFLVTIQVGKKRVLAHLPNPGRLKELLLPGSDLLVVHRTGKRRKTLYQILAVTHERESILLDTRLSNGIVEEAIVRGELRQFEGWRVVRREFTWKDSRFDFLLEKRDWKCIAEVKACTLVEEGRALFPDAPTIRGRRHVITLARSLKRGYRACLLFMVHRRGARSFLANDVTDTKFSDSLSRAIKAGVEVYAFECSWKNSEVRVGRQIPVVSRS